MKVNKILITFLLMLFTLNLYSCKPEEVYNREYNESEVLLYSRELIEKSLVLNEILYGEGLAYDENVGVGIYKQATNESLAKYQIENMKSLTDKIEAVFSDSYIRTINSSDIFNSVTDDGVIVSYSRYFEDETEDEGEEKISKILVNSKYDYFLKNKYEYIGDISVKGSEGEYVIVSALVRATRADGKSRDFNLDIKLIEEEDGWRISTPTYIVYNEYTDIYEDMIK